MSYIDISAMFYGILRRAAFMLHIMNAENWIDPRSEMKYQFHQTIGHVLLPAGA